jgi:hypothetical protein
MSVLNVILIFYTYRQIHLHFTGNRYWISKKRSGESNGRCRTSYTNERKKLGVTFLLIINQQLIAVKVIK